MLLLKNGVIMHMMQTNEHLEVCESPGYVIKKRQRKKMGGKVQLRNRLVKGFIK